MEFDTLEDGNLAVGYLRFDPDDPIYRDHFPGNPVTPGSLVIQGFVDAARKLGECESIRGIEKFKFRRFVSPGTYRFEIRRSVNKMHCRLYDPESAILVSGALIL